MNTDNIIAVGILRIRRSNLLLMCVFIRKKIRFNILYMAGHVGGDAISGDSCRSSDLPLVGNKSFLRVVVLFL